MKCNAQGQMHSLSLCGCVCVCIVVAREEGRGGNAYAHSYVDRGECPTVACVACSHVQPVVQLRVACPKLPPVPSHCSRCLVKSFCFQMGAKETNHLHTANCASPNKLTAIKRLWHSVTKTGQAAGTEAAFVWGW